VKNLVNIEKTGVIQMPQNLWVGFRPKLALAGLDDGAPEPAPDLAVISYVFCILDRAHVSPDLLSLSAVQWVDWANITVAKDPSRHFPR
jgi:hypothetical protein